MVLSYLIMIQMAMLHSNNIQLRNFKTGTCAIRMIKKEVKTTKIGMEDLLN